MNLISRSSPGPDPEDLDEDGEYWPDDDSGPPDNEGEAPEFQDEGMSSAEKFADMNAGGSGECIVLLAAVSGMLGGLGSKPPE